MNSWAPGGDATRGAEGLKDAETEPSWVNTNDHNELFSALTPRLMSMSLSTLAFPQILRPTQDLVEALPSACGHSLHPSDLGSQVTSSAPSHSKVATPPPSPIRWWGPSLHSLLHSHPGSAEYAAPTRWDRLPAPRKAHSKGATHIC